MYGRNAVMPHVWWAGEQQTCSLQTFDKWTLLGFEWQCIPRRTNRGSSPLFLGPSRTELSVGERREDTARWDDWTWEFHHCSALRATNYPNKTINVIDLWSSEGMWLICGLNTLTHHQYSFTSLIHIKQEHWLMCFVMSQCQSPAC